MISKLLIELLKFKHGSANNGVIDSISKNGCGVATRTEKITDLLTLGFYPKPSYNQLGVYHGDMTGFKKGDEIRITYRQKTDSFWKNLYNSLVKNNIIKIEKT